MERGPQVGGALTSLGCRDSGAPGSAGGAGRGALRSPCGREAGCSLVFRGTQPQTRTPREGRGGAGAGAARGGAGEAGDSRPQASGAQGQCRVTVPGVLGHPDQPAPCSPARASPLRLGLPPPVPGRSLHLYLPSPGVGRIPSPSAWLRSPWNFSEEERLLRKERTRHKDAEREGGSNGWQVLAQGPVHSPWALP